MLNTTFIPARNLQKSYKSIIESVKKTNQAVVLTTKNEPLAAIVSLKDLERLKVLKNKQSTKALLDLAGIIPKGSGLPEDLSEKHDEYTWS